MNSIRLRLKGLIYLYSLIIIFFSVSADASSVIIKPDVLYPGDIFFIKLSYPAESLLRAEFNGIDLYFSSCGERCSYAIGAIDIETKPGVYRIKIFPKKGREIFFSIKVRKKEFPLIHLELPEDKVTLSPENLARAEAEEELLRAIWQLRTERLWSGVFTKPIESEVSTSYGVKRMINRKKLSIHKGIDLRAKEGDPVKAVNNGRVVLTEELFFGGKTVVIDHGEGLFSVYMHLSGYTVREGDIVLKGDLIGFAGATGRASGPHLHFGFKVKDISINPESLFELKELPPPYE
ncbi:MAG: M23 family metallopeptidase [Thermodesulfovibrionales bacterium]|nr:M23 family metallopeptidase [Thermodesulfovibrionales bacterium]